MTKLEIPGPETGARGPDSVIMNLYRQNRLLLPPEGAGKPEAAAGGRTTSFIDDFQ